MTEEGCIQWRYKMSPSSVSQLCSSDAFYIIVKTQVILFKVITITASKVIRYLYNDQNLALEQKGMKLVHYKNCEHRLLDLQIHEISLHIKH